VIAELADGVQKVGRYATVLDGKNLASGTYFYRLVATAQDGSGRSFTEVRKLALIK